MHTPIHLPHPDFYNRVPSCAIPGNMSFHASAKKEQEATTDANLVAKEQGKGGLFGTGLSEWFALPVGIVAAVPLIKFDWYVINEETQLMAVFIAFVVTLYTQGGDAIYKAIDERAVTLLKDHSEAEEKVIEALEQKLVFLKANQNMVNDFNAINEIREETYKKLNAAGAIKPQHDFKAQVERLLNMIATEEANVADKTKMALMSEATATVTEQFSTDKALKKAALDSAIAKLKGASTGADPVQAAFVQFFKDKAAAAKASKDDSEEKAQRAALIAKMNSVAKNEGFFFEFDASGLPKMKA